MRKRFRSRLATAVLTMAVAVPLGGCDLLLEMLGVELTPEEAIIKDLFVDKYIVKLGGEPADVAQEVNVLQDAVAYIFEFEPIHIFQESLAGFQVELPWAAVEALESEGTVEYIVLDEDKSYSPPPGTQPPQFGEGEVTDAIARVGGPASVVLSGVEVAVVDTGVDLDHPDLNVVGSADLVAEAGGEDSGGDDLNGHGTHVAGTIGARADGDGVVGVAPGVGIHAVRVLDRDGGGSLGDIIAGLEYVLQNPSIKVVNMSLGGMGETSPPAPLAEAIENLEAAGVVVCIAAGNEGDDTSFYIPAGYDRGIVVSAYDSEGGDNGFADFSNYGSAVDVAAPGVSITSTMPDGQYGALDGTSMATPHVAGAAAAYMAQNPGASPSEVKSALTSSGESGYPGQGGGHPEPLLDVSALLR